MDRGCCEMDNEWIGMCWVGMVDGGGQLAGGL